MQTHARMTASGSGSPARGFGAGISGAGPCEAGMPRASGQGRIYSVSRTRDPSAETPSSEGLELRIPFEQPLYDRAIEYLVRAVRDVDDPQRVPRVIETELVREAHRAVRLHRAIDGA